MSGRSRVTGPCILPFRVWAAAIAFLSVAVLALGMPVHGRGGAFDRTFGRDGRVELRRFSPGDGMAIARDGRIIVAGSSDGRFAIARFRRDGRPDRSFGGDGLVRLRNPSPACTDGRSTDVHVLADGRILAIGHVGGSITDGLGTACGRRETIAMYRSDGRLDPSFGNSGLVTGPTVRCGDASLAGDVLADGRIVAAGFGCDEDVAIVRLRRDGSPDLTFGGGDGRAEVSALEGIWPERLDLAVLRDGKAVVVTAAEMDLVQGEGVPVTAFAIVRVGIEGLPDPSFGGGDGVVATTFQSGRCTAGALATAVGIGKDGRIVVGGWASCRDPGQSLPRPRIVFARYLPDGDLDDAFGDGGRARILLPIEEGMDYVYRLALQLDGRIVAVGTNGKALVVRVRRNGRLDGSFARGGMLEAWKNGYASSVAIDRAGRIVVAGGRFAPGAFLARYEST